MRNIYATAVEYKGCAVLITGPSGSGKSDLALRLITRHGAVLIADDRTDIAVSNGKLQVSAPHEIAGLMEVRGVGIVKLPYRKRETAALIVDLQSSRGEIERLPADEFSELEGIRLPRLKLYAFDASASDKIVIKIDSLLD